MLKLRREWNLFLVLARMHLRSSDYRTAFGALWSFMGPLMTFLILYTIFRDRFGHTIPLFPLRILIGIISLNFFVSVVHITMNAIKQSREIVINSLTPSEVLILAPLAVPVVRFSVEITLCIFLAIMNHVMSVQNLPLIFLISFLYLVLSVGVGLLLSAFDCLAADITEIWNRIVPMFYFITPIFYVPEMLSGWARGLIYWLNPITPYLMTYLSLFSVERLSANDSIAATAQVILYPIVFFTAGFIAFKKLEKQIVQE